LWYNIRNELAADQGAGRRKMSRAIGCFGLREQGCVNKAAGVAA